MEPMGKKPIQPLRILLADDDADVRATIRLVLEMDRHEVVEAEDGVAALELFNSGMFDLVVTDYVMPGMSGDLLAVEVKNKDASMPVIMITANADILPSPLVGVDLLISKPFQVKDLVASIRKIAAKIPRPSTTEGS